MYFSDFRNKSKILVIVILGMLTSSLEKKCVFSALLDPRFMDEVFVRNPCPKETLLSVFMLNVELGAGGASPS